MSFWKPSRRALRWISMGAGVLLVLGVVALLTAKAPWFLLEANTLQKVDGMVVLGGEPWTRPHRAVELFRAGITEHVIVSGAGDSEEVRRLLCSKGVPANAI